MKLCIVSTPTGCTTKVGGACCIPCRHDTSDAGSDHPNSSSLVMMAEHYWNVCVEWSVTASW